MRRPRHAHQTRKVYLPPSQEEIAERRQHALELREREITAERGRMPKGRIRHHGRVLLSEHFTIDAEHYYKSGAHAEAWMREMAEREAQA